MPIPPTNYRACLIRIYFLRINREYIINIDSIATMYSYSSSRIKLTINNENKDVFIVIREIILQFKKWIDSRQAKKRPVKTLSSRVSLFCQLTLEPHYRLFFIVSSNGFHFSVTSHSCRSNCQDFTSLSQLPDFSRLHFA